MRKLMGDTFSKNMYVPITKFTGPYGRKTKTKPVYGFVDPHGRLVQSSTEEGAKYLAKKYYKNLPEST